MAKITNKNQRSIQKIRTTTSTTKIVDTKVERKNMPRNMD